MPTESELLLQSEFAAERLRNDIVSGAWSPGRKLKMRKLLPRYGVGASPMREALARLLQRKKVTVVATDAMDGLIEAFADLTGS